MPLCVDKLTSIVEAVDESAREVFSMMAGETLDRIELQANDSPFAESGPALTVILGLTGDLRGSVSLSLVDAASLLWTNRLIDLDLTEVDQNVIDAVGELGNMAVGGAKRRLSAEHELTLSLPSVFRGGQEQLVFPSRVRPVRVPYALAGHSVTAVIALE